MAIGVSATREAMNSIASREGPSRRCASSTTTSSGRARAAAASSDAAAHRRRSGHRVAGRPRVRRAHSRVRPPGACQLGQQVERRPALGLEACEGCSATRSIPLFAAPARPRSRPRRPRAARSFRPLQAASAPLRLGRRGHRRSARARERGQRRGRVEPLPPDRPAAAARGSGPVGERALEPPAEQLAGCGAQVGYGVAYSSRNVSRDPCP